MNILKLTRAEFKALPAITTLVITDSEKAGIKVNQCNNLSIRTDSTGNLYVAYSGYHTDSLAMIAPNGETSITNEGKPAQRLAAFITEYKINGSVSGFEARKPRTRKAPAPETPKAETPAQEKRTRKPKAEKPAPAQEKPTPAESAPAPTPIPAPAPETPKAAESTPVPEKPKAEKPTPAPANPCTLGDWKVEIKGHEMLTKFFNDGDSAVAYALKMRKERFSTAVVYLQEKVFEVFEWEEPTPAPETPAPVPETPTPAPTPAPTPEVKKFATALAALSQNGMGLGLYGAAGTGKTYTAERIAECMGLPSILQGRVSHPAELKGFTDANGNYHPSPLFHAMTNGGVLICDEFDSWDSDCITAINTAMAQRRFEFSCGEVKAHENFHVIVTQNTRFGGNTDGYIRSELDISTLNRFAYFEIGYPEKLEKAQFGEEMANFVKECRETLKTNGTKGIISLRNMYSYRALLPIMGKNAALVSGLFSTISDKDMVARFVRQAKKLSF